MKYKCADRGGGKCPCVLMECGQCYTCTMNRNGICDCGEEWAGVCPYTEFMQAGMVRQAPMQEFEAPVVEMRRYSAQLAVVRLEVPPGAGQACRAAGSFVMVESLGHWMPLSVLKAELDMEARRGFVELAVQPAGPKSGMLIGNPEDETPKTMKIRGPYVNGLLNKERLNKDEPLLVVAKGTAAAPFVNIKDNFNRENVKVMLDCDKLTEDFAETYLGDTGYEDVSLAGDLGKICAGIDKFRQIMFLASPFYTEKIFEMRPGRRSDIITANHSNMCCGEGICGACSHTDKDGVTVRMCKCMERQGW